MEKMIKASVEHWYHPKRPAGTCDLIEFRLPLTTNDVQSYITKERDFPSSCDYFLEILNPDDNRFYTLNDKYLCMHSTQTALAKLVPIHLKVTWMINNNVGKENIRQYSTEMALDKNSSELNHLILENVNAIILL